MAEGNKQSEIFNHGSIWLRADFHLHTKADKEFEYSGDPKRFVSEYVAGLKSAGIGLGVIANHNKFDKDEFRALRKKGRKEGVYLLPGVELSVNDGANGVHILIVFSDQWLQNGNDYISPFITSMFPGKAESEYQNENGRSDKNFLQVVEELDKTSRDYFLVGAHVEQKSGLWFEMAGGKLGDFTENRYHRVRERLLGFQKVRSRDEREKVQRWLNGWYPAEVEGSDCKKIEHIGRGKVQCYLKIGAFSFDAVKFALTDKAHRVCKEPIEHKNSYIRSICFEGGILDGEEIYFSPEMTTLIGIRGSGKSSVLEVLRYALDLPFGEKAGDIKYKEGLVGHTLASGGKVIIRAVDRFGQPYEIHRVFKEPYSEVFREGVLQPGVSIRETVLHKPIYFGQKDLSNTGEGFEKDLVEKLLGAKLDDIRQKIDRQKGVVGGAVDCLIRVANARESIDEQTEIKQDTEYRLAFYKEHGVEEKLQKRLDFDADIRKMKKGVELADAMVADLRELCASHEDDVRNFAGYTSKHNRELFEKYDADFNGLVEVIDTLKQALARSEKSRDNLAVKRQELDGIRKGLVDEFAGIERRLAEELKSSGTPNISSDEFLRLKKKLASTNRMLEELQKQGDRKKEYEGSLLKELHHLNELWHQEFQLITQQLDQVGKNSASLSIRAEYKEAKGVFLGFMKEVFRGSGIRETTFRKIVDTYQDFIDIYKDLDNARELFGNNPHTLTGLIMKNLKTLLTYQVPNKFTIMYQGKELQHHSLGQRASALILFVLSQRENDVIVIDQPEDDLDNQTIYEDVIKLIRRMKQEVQFIFATHNPNIPVLGDAEQVLACSCEDDRVFVQSGSVDRADIQGTIVNIMEGGREAFNRRKEIYQIWKP